jgi:hypothetical protein
MGCGAGVGHEAFKLHPLGGGDLLREFERRSAAAMPWPVMPAYTETTTLKFAL